MTDKITGKISTIGKILAFSFYLGLAVLFCTAIVPAQDSKEDGKDWYPLEPGDTWTYQHESRDAGINGNRPPYEVHQWKTKETIVSTFPVPELGATMVTKSTKVLSDTFPPGSLPEGYLAKREWPVSHLLIRQNCVYLLDGLDFGGGWPSIQVSDTESLSPLDDANQIRPAYSDALLHGDVGADFCFPMAKGNTWGKVPSTSPANEYVWHVIAFNADPFRPPGADTYHLQSYLGSGDFTDRWFAKGVGVVQENGQHHGTYDEEDRLLLNSTIDGHTETYQLTPARTVPLGKDDCDDSETIGWQNFARADGTPFQDMADCVSYVSAGTNTQ